jgi:hypothetical protein
MREEKMIKKSLFIIGALLCWQLVSFVGSGLCASTCEEECYPRAMQNMVEGRVAQMNCLQACRQRKVWEQMVLAIDRLSVQLASQLKDKNSQDNVTMTGTSMQRANFEEAEPSPAKEPEYGTSSFGFGSMTRSNVTYTNTTLITPTIVNATFRNTTP